MRTIPWFLRSARRDLRAGGSRAVQIYLPIADLPVNVFLVFAMGLAVGFISGMFGIGGGFLMTPLLIFIGVSPAVSVASVASHIAASSFSGGINYWRRRAVDLALASMLLAGGLYGCRRGGLVVHRSAGDRATRSRYRPVLCRAVERCRQLDDRGERTRNHARAARQAGRVAAPREPYLVSWAAIQTAVQTVAH